LYPLPPIWDKLNIPGALHRNIFPHLTLAVTRSSRIRQIQFWPIMSILNKSSASRDIIIHAPRLQR